MEIFLEKKIHLKIIFSLSSKAIYFKFSGSVFLVLQITSKKQIKKKIKSFMLEKKL